MVEVTRAATDVPQGLTVPGGLAAFWCFFTWRGFALSRSLPRRAGADLVERELSELRPPGAGLG